MKIKVLIVALLATITSQGQELFVMTEPASNAPAGAISVRIGQSLLNNEIDKKNIYTLSPEVTWGISKDLMFRGSAYLDNLKAGLGFTGGGAYLKYRFLSTDDIQSHFRMASFARYSYSSSPIMQQAIDLNGMNSGVEAGIVATQLIKKVAISSSLSYVRALDNGSNDFPSHLGRNAINYTLSAGRLMYPKKYTNYKQTNINLMFELVGQTNTSDGRSYLDAVPSLQFIINSQARVDIAYKKQLYSSLDRLSSDGVFLKLEYTFFNALN